MPCSAIPIFSKNALKMHLDPEKTSIERFVTVCCFGNEVRNGDFKSLERLMGLMGEEPGVEEGGVHIIDDL